MANLEDLVVSIRLNSDQMRSQLTGVKSQMAGLGTGATGAAGGVTTLGASLKGLAGSLGLVMGVAQVISFLKESAKAAAEDNEAQAMLARQMKATVGATDEQIAGIEKQIGALEALTGVADDEIRPSYQKLLLATKDVNKAMALQKLAMDVAAGSGKPLGAVTMALSRAMSGNENALNRLVPSIKNAKDKFAELDKQFSGAAKKAADTNPYKRLGVAMDNIKEGIGRGLLPIVESLSKLMQKFVPIFDKVGQVLDKFLTPVMDLVDVIMDELMPILDELQANVMPLIDEAFKPLGEIIRNVVAPAVKMIGEWIQFLMPVIKVLQTAALQPLIQGMRFLAFVLKPVIGFIQSLWNRLKPLRKTLAEFGEIARQVGQQIWDKLGKYFKMLVDYVNKHVKPLWDGLMKAMKPFSDWLSGVFGKVIKWISDKFSGLASVIKPILESLGKLLGIKIDMKAVKAAGEAAVADKPKADAKAKEDKFKYTDSYFGLSPKETKVDKSTKIHNTVNAKTDAKPTEIAANLVNAIKFNLPVIMAGQTGVLAAGIGSQIGGIQMSGYNPAGMGE